MYYLRSKAPVKAVQVTLDPKLAREQAELAREQADLLRDFNSASSSKASSSSSSLALVNGNPTGSTFSASASAAAGPPLSAEEIYAMRQAKQAEADKRQAADDVEKNGACGGACSA
jgi:hypothetical protein